MWIGIGCLVVLMIIFGCLASGEANSPLGVCTLLTGLALVIVCLNVNSGKYTCADVLARDLYRVKAVIKHDGNTYKVLNRMSDDEIFLVRFDAVVKDGEYYKIDKDNRFYPVVLEKTPIVEGTDN